jgi:hypothetical protein
MKNFVKAAKVRQRGPRLPSRFTFFVSRFTLGTQDLLPKIAKGAKAAMYFTFFAFRFASQNADYRADARRRKGLALHAPASRRGSSSKDPFSWPCRVAASNWDSSLEARVGREYHLAMGTGESGRPRRRRCCTVLLLLPETHYVNTVETEFLRQFAVSG